METTTMNQMNQISSKMETMTNQLYRLKANSSSHLINQLSKVVRAGKTKA